MKDLSSGQVQHLKGWIVFSEDDDGRGRLVKITAPNGDKSLIAMSTRNASTFIEAMKSAGAKEPTGQNLAS